MKIFALPDIGEGLQEAEIVAWHVSPGDHVVADQPVVSVETDKAVVELPSPWSGTVAKLNANVGDIVAIGTPLIEYDNGAGGDAGAIVGELAKAVSEKTPGVPSTAPAGGEEPSAGEVVTPRVRASPAVRAYAKESGVDLSGIRGSGPDGAIIKSDVDGARPAGKVTVEGFAPIKGPRRALAVNMARAGRTVVPATVTDLIDVSSWWQTGADVTTRAIAAIAHAAAQEPSLNAWFDGESLTVKLHEVVDLGLAVDAPDGLFVPVIRNAGSLTEIQISRSVKELAGKVSRRVLTPEDLRGPTITLSNFGAIAGRHASLVLMPPQVAIIGIGRIETALKLQDGGVVEGNVLPVSLTFDHRAVTGGEAARFLAAFGRRMAMAQ